MKLDDDSEKKHLEEQVRVLQAENALLKKGDGTTDTRKKPHEAIEWIIQNKLIPLLDKAKNKVAAAAASGPVAWHWHFQDPIGGMMKCNAAVSSILSLMMDARADWMHKQQHKFFTSHGILDPKYASHFEVSASAVQHKAPFNIIPDLLKTGTIVPLYNGVDAFGGGLYMNVTSGVLFTEANQRAHSSTGQDKLIMVVESNVIHSQGPISQMKGLVWCIDLTNPAVPNRPPVMTSYIDGFHYLLIPANDPSNALVVVSLRQRLFAFPIQKSNIGNTMPALADAMAGKFTLINTMILLTHSRQSASYNTSALVTTHWFKTEFKREITDPLQSATAPMNWLTPGAKGVCQILDALGFLLYTTVLPNTIMKWKSSFPGLGTGQVLTVQLGSINIPIGAFDISQLTQHVWWMDSFKNLNDHLFLTTFCSMIPVGSSVNGLFDKFHFWIDLHGSPHFYDVKICWNSNPSIRSIPLNGKYVNIQQTSRHANRTAEIKHMAPVVGMDHAAHWNSMVGNISQKEMDTLLTDYAYDGASYAIPSKIFDKLADKWHEHSIIPTTPYTYDGSLLSVHPAKLKLFLQHIMGRYKGSFRPVLHGTGQIVSILEDPNGFDLGYAHHQKQGVTISGSVYGHGIYLGLDDAVAHSYNKTYSEGTYQRKLGNVLMGMVGWDSSIIIPSTVVTGTTGVHQIASPLCKLFAHACATHYNGISLQDPTDVLNFGEINEKKNVPELKKSTNLEIKTRA